MEKQVKFLRIIIFILALVSLLLVIWINSLNNTINKNADIMNQNFQKIENYLNLR